jgi:hypothetical protein
MFNREKVRLLENRCRAHEEDIQSLKGLIQQFNYYSGVYDAYNKSNNFADCYVTSMQIFSDHVDKLKSIQHDKKELEKLQKGIKQLIADGKLKKVECL